MGSRRRTAWPGWNGERVDYDLIVQGLTQLGSSLGISALVADSGRWKLANELPGGTVTGGLRLVQSTVDENDRTLGPLLNNETL